MSSNLARTANLLADNAFLAKVKAAMTEHALSVANDTTGSFPLRQITVGLATAVVYDADAYLPPFARVCADDAAISSSATTADVTDADLRRVVSTTWSAIAASVPNLR